MFDNTDKYKKKTESPDDFWNIDMLIPKKKLPSYRQASDTSTVEIDINTKESSKAVETNSDDNRFIIRRFVPPHTEAELLKPEADIVHKPKNSLIHEVSVYKSKEEYKHFERFCDDCVRISKMKCTSRGARNEKTPPHFFSVMPQYSQMNREQLEFYLFWREYVRSCDALGKQSNHTQAIVPTSESYILLYINELVNLQNVTGADQCRNELLKVWRKYRKSFPRIDYIIPEVICDIGLLNGMPPPILYGAELQTVMKNCSLKEYFIADITGNDVGSINTLIRYCSAYDYKKSKFYSAGNEDYFDKFIPLAIMYAADKLTDRSDGRIFGAKIQDSRLSRTAFSGVLAGYAIRCRLDVEYSSFSSSNELRFLISDMIKYIENKIRTALHIKSKLTVYSLPESVRACIDEYMATAMPKKNFPAHEDRLPVADYEKNYEPEIKRALSFENAEKIEQESWENTKRLVGNSFDISEEVTDTSAAENDMMKNESARNEDISVEEISDLPESAQCTGENMGFRSALGDLVDFLDAAMSCDSAAQRSIARRLGMMPDTIADMINEKATELLGDIILEETNGYYSVIDEYKDLV